MWSIYTACCLIAATQRCIYRSGWTCNAKILSLWWHRERSFTHGINWRRLAQCIPYNCQLGIPSAYLCFSKCTIQFAQEKAKGVILTRMRSGVYRVAQKMSHWTKRNFLTTEIDFYQHFRVYRGRMYTVQGKDFSIVVEKFTKYFIASKITAFTIFCSVLQNYADRNGQSLVMFTVQCR